MTNLPHYFIAIPIPETLKDIFFSWQNDLKKRLPYKQWPNKHDLHITLKFLGPVDETNLKALQTELNQLEDGQQFSLKVGGLGTFGNPDSPRVLWAGVERNETINYLQQRVESCAVKHGFKQEQRSYHPHITLAKKWNGSIDSSVISNVKKYYNDIEHLLSVEEVVVYKIYPGRTPKYEIVSRYTLKGGGGDGAVN